MAAQSKLKWRNASKDNPGFTVWYANPDRDPDVLYMIRRKRAKRGFTPTIWRVFMRPTPGEQARTIYVANTTDEAKEYVRQWEEMIVASLNIEPVPTI